MDKRYADTVRLLLAVAPDVFAGSVFALKGGTAINLFVRDMPRLSVDLDLVFTSWSMPREEAIVAITAELAEIAHRLSSRRLNIRAVADRDGGESKLLIDNGASSVKVEVNTVFRGTVLPTQTRALVPATADLFSTELSLPILDLDELYAGKIIAALDRQHPRDLFDIAQIYQSEGVTETMIECVVTYLAGHGRPAHEVLFPRAKDITREFEATFVGMTTEPVTLDTLLLARSRLMDELPARLTNRQRRFLIGHARAEPDWSLLQCPHAADLPAIRWKLLNLERFKASRHNDFVRQAQLLQDRLDETHPGP